MPPLCLAALVVVSFSTPVDLRPAIPAPGLVADAWPVTDTSEPLLPIDAGPRLVPPPGDWQLLLARAGVRRRKTPMPWPEENISMAPVQPPRPAHPWLAIAAVAYRVAQWTAIMMAGSMVGFLALGLAAGSASREAAARESFRQYATHMAHVRARPRTVITLDVRGMLTNENN